ncbi:dna helicase [Moniliophthora roreri]|nr:dna helicase [Moniliophthora roreri]
MQLSHLHSQVLHPALNIYRSLHSTFTANLCNFCQRTLLILCVWSGFLMHWSVPEAFLCSSG